MSECKHNFTEFDGFYQCRECEMVVEEDAFNYFADKVSALQKQLEEQVTYSSSIIDSFNKLNSKIGKRSCEMLGDDGERYMAIEIPEIEVELDNVEMAIIEETPKQSLAEHNAQVIEQAAEYFQHKIDETPNPNQMKDYDRQANNQFYIDMCEHLYGYAQHLRNSAKKGMPDTTTITTKLHSEIVECLRIAYSNAYLLYSDNTFNQRVFDREVATIDKVLAELEG